MTTINASNFAYVQFTKALLEECQAQGLTPITADTESGLPQNEGWCFLRFSPDGAALIIPKGKVRMGNLHSHVDLSGREGYVPLPKKNGKVICHFSPDLAKVKPILSAFVGAAKRATLGPTPKATVGATPVTPPVTGNLDIPEDQWAALASYSEDDSEEVQAVGA